MDLWQAILLGLVEGLTEYLPVSSTGHILVAQRILGIPATEAANAYAIAIQAGAIAAVMVLYRERLARMCRGVLGRDGQGARLATALLIAFAPAAIVGLAFDDMIEEHLFGPWPIVVAWALGGVVLLVFGAKLRGRGGLPIEDIGPRVALLIGVAQCAALWPGVSRSLATILGALLLGLSMSAAVEFSFLLGLITLGAATAYKTLQSGGAMLTTYGWLPLAAGFAAAWISAVLAIRWMVSWLTHRGLGVFGWWRLGAAASVGVLLFLGMM
ncbi:MAG: undecaprenyl-diphosphate phosphatase [Myxococcales bacterium]|jgi:undecaprenyl-diphosphatase|nr:undecaprenyl-diphosphate phosphatase [Myxococcales bacterium]